jgi:hypothetical protein
LLSGAESVPDIVKDSEAQVADSQRAVIDVPAPLARISSRLTGFRTAHRGGAPQSGASPFFAISFTGGFSNAGFGARGMSSVVGNPKIYTKQDIDR